MFNQKDKISFPTFSRLLSVFRQIREENKIRYYYACAGGLYPIDIFVYVKENRVEGLEEGLYYYNPRENALYLVNNDVITDQAHYFTNKAIYNSSAFSLFFIYNAEVTMPKYGADGYFYACIDTGIMVSTLTHVAEALNIGLCSIGDMMFDQIREKFNLAEEQVWIHTVEGGIKPNSEESMAVEERVYGFTDADWPEESEVRTMVSAANDSKQENELTTGLSNDLRLVLLSGDWIPVKLPERIEEYFCQAKIVSLGGATEASIWSIYYPIDQVKEDWVSIPYGMPLANQKFYVLDYEHRLCPVGVPGELYIGGLGVAEGYLNDPEKTRNSFIHHPKLGRLYRTGDYGILHKNGYIEFLGRKDHQVKIRGYRIELGEIESCLLKHSSVKRAVVVDVKDKEGTKSLCAYIVPKARVTGRELREHLVKLLPDYMIPSYFVQLQELPLTPNGKVNIKALPEPEQTMDDGNEYTEAQNEIEEKLVTIWTSVLGVEKVGTNDNFFEKGGNSVLLVRMHNEIEKLYPGSTRIADLFNNPTIISQAKYIKNSLASSSGDLRRTGVPILEPLPFPADYFLAEDESSEETFLKFQIPDNLLKTVNNIAEEEGVSVADLLLSMYIYLISEVTGLQEITIQTVLEKSSTVYPLKISLQTVPDLSALFRIVNEECRKKPSEKSYKIDEVSRDLAKGAFSVLPLYCASEFLASAEDLLKIYDLVIAVGEADGALSVVCEYNGERLKEEKMKQFINGYMKFIRLLENEYSSNQ
ncbi:MAG TPA: AMP-binding protein [Firmicutes bacterium]|nr:AMP-binding protein [Bacillota bacterium]